MTEGEVQGKWVLVRNNGEFEITEFKLVGSNCSWKTLAQKKRWPNMVSVLNTGSSGPGSSTDRGVFSCHLVCLGFSEEDLLAKETKLFVT